MMGTDLASSLQTAMADRALVRLTRKLEHGEVDGYVVGVSGHWLLMLSVGPGISYEGYQAFRLRDVASLVSPSPRAAFYQAVLRKRGLRRPPTPHIELSSTDGLIRSAAKHFPLITIHREKADPGVCHIGQLDSVSSTSFSLLEVTPDGEWEESPSSYRIPQVTRIDFGGLYENALALVAFDRLAKKPSRRRPATSAAKP